MTVTFLLPLSAEHYHEGTRVFQQSDFWRWHKVAD